MLTPMRGAQCGATLLDMVIAMGIAAVLVAIAYPSYADQIRKTRRTDAITRLALLQQAQERWRTNHPTYGSLEELRIPSSAADSHYALNLSSADAGGYVVVAEANGAQESDRRCRFLRLSVVAGQAVHASGPDAAAANGEPANRMCWNR
jgi:type IV pilus assembly protein PilE